MKRLTFNGDFCDIAQCFEAHGGEQCPDGYCAQRRVWERLKEYEDTGLEPEEVRRLKKEWTELIMPPDEWGYMYHLRELAQAEVDGRLVVLPFRIGDKVYRVATRKKYINNPKIAMYIKEIVIKPENVHKYINEVGRTVFLTREEAEAVLEAQKGGAGE